MKKLMIAAAVAAMIGGVQAACEDPEETKPEVDCAVAYEFKASLTTTAAKFGKVSWKDDCGDKYTEVTCYREKGKKTIKGYYYACDCVCDLADTDMFDLVLWDDKVKGCAEVVDFDFVLLQTFGKKLDKVEAFFELATSENGEYFAAGQGKVDTKNGLVKSISGDIVGLLDAPDCQDDECEDGDDFPEDLRFGAICEDAAALDEASTAAFGSWSLKYNKSLSKKLLKNSIGSVLPKKVTLCE